MPSLLDIIMQNKLTRDNFKDWKRNLMIVLSCEKHKFVLSKKCPPETDVAERECWRNSNYVARCYIIGSISVDIQKQIESIKAARLIMKKIGGYVRRPGTLGSANRCNQSHEL